MKQPLNVTINNWLRNALSKLPDQPISAAYSKYKDTVKSPLVTAAILGGGAYLAGIAAWGPTVETLRALGRRPGRRMFGDGKEADDMYDKTIDELKNDSSLKRYLPAALAGLAAFVPLYSANNILTYRDALKKKASLDAMDSMSYLQQLDWGQPINARQANSLFADDEHLDKDQYARHMGMAIVNNAALSNHTGTPTLGNIFDAATDKIEKKLTLGGLANVGVRTVVANSAARLFTGALGSVMDLSPQARRNIVDAGTWAGAVAAILD